MDCPYVYMYGYKCNPMQISILRSSAYFHQKWDAHNFKPATSQPQHDEISFQLSKAFPISINPDYWNDFYKWKVFASRTYTLGTSPRELSSADWHEASPLISQLVGAVISAGVLAEKCLAPLCRRRPWSNSALCTPNQHFPCSQDVYYYGMRWHGQIRGMMRPRVGLYILNMAGSLEMDALPTNASSMGIKRIQTCKGHKEVEASSVQAIAKPVSFSLVVNFLNNQSTVP